MKLKSTGLTGLDMEEWDGQQGMRTTHLGVRRRKGGRTGEHQVSTLRQGDARVALRTPVSPFNPAVTPSPSVWAGTCSYSIEDCHGDEGSVLCLSNTSCVLVSCSSGHTGVVHMTRNSAQPLGAESSPAKSQQWAKSQPCNCKELNSAISLLRSEVDPGLSL